MPKAGAATGGKLTSKLRAGEIKYPCSETSSKPARYREDVEQGSPATKKNLKRREKDIYSL